MAFDISNSTARQYYPDAIKEGYENTDLYGTTTNTVDLGTDIDALIDALIATPPADEAGWLGAMDTLKTDIATAIATRTEDVSYHDILDAITETIRTSIAGIKPVLDGRCNGNGRYPKSNDTGNPADTVKIHCKTCDGYGQVETADMATPTISYPEYPIV